MAYFPRLPGASLLNELEALLGRYISSSIQPLRLREAQERMAVVYQALYGMTKPIR